MVSNVLTESGHLKLIRPSSAELSFQIKLGSCENLFSSDAIEGKNYIQNNFFQFFKNIF
jgi:hypothetical protein